MYLKIAICEDNREDCSTLKSMIDDFLTAHDVKAEISVYSCGEDFLIAHRSRHYDIVFMDIYLTGIDGMVTAAAARSEKNIQIVFTTCSREYAIEAFRLDAVHYLVKPFPSEAVAEALKRCFSRMEFRCSGRLDIKINRETISIPMENIVYIEVFNKVCLIHTKTNIFQTYSSLDAIFRLLDNSIFLRVQRSFIVNMSFIQSFYFDHIILADGTEIVLSRNNRTELKQQYRRFLLHLSGKEMF